MAAAREALPEALGARRRRQRLSAAPPPNPPKPPPRPVSCCWSKVRRWTGRRRAAFWWRNWLNAVAPTNFLIKHPTIIQHDQHEFIFEGFSMFTVDKIPEVPVCKVLRFNIEYNICFFKFY